MALTDACPSCGAANEAAARFCGECGTALHPAAGARRAPLAERRVVSVMFADLVGFSRLTAENDAEEVREWLSRYFAAAQRLVDLYGGVIEKFIGDAVVAIWGAPLANEDDAERAVRTALDLVTAVAALAEELDRPELRIRVGVLTGEAVVTVGAESEGMIAGDAVNMASRIQTVAAPGTVWVGETTRRASAASIAYEDVGLHAVKGRDEPLRLYRAMHVTAARRGERRSLGLEPPFAGRTREFRGVTDVFHASVEDRRARIVTVTGIAGVGKSRLSWEFEKHVDGLALEVAWHHGRCLAYGQGVAFAALAEMVRSRARISEETPTIEAVARLGAMLDDVAVTPDEREFLEPRLAHLLGLTDRRAPDREDLFSAWRLFFERLADDRPVALVFDDLQWADDVLLDFIEYLLDWSRDYPIFILALARPELLERRPALGVGRDHTTLALEPLVDGAMDELLDGLVPGLPADLRGRIVERSEGVPLYAVETVRMLLDRGLVEPSGDTYSAVGTIEALDVPETLHALVAARLDSLEPAERRLLEDAAVLGKTFTRQGLVALSGLTDESVEPLVRSLLRKEAITVQSDPLSPDRGQLSFVQDLLRVVAYETLSLRERKLRHLAAAAHLAEWESDDEVTVRLAAHYLDAYRSGQGDADAGELRSQARTALARAGEQTLALAAGGEACRFFEQAAELADDPRDRAELLERAGDSATEGGLTERATADLRQAVEIFNKLGDRRAAARAEARTAEVLRHEMRVSEAYDLMSTAYDALTGGPRDAEFALVAAQLGRMAYFIGDVDRAAEAVELALEISEALDLAEPLASALNTKGCLLYRREHESSALLRESLRIARGHDLPAATQRALFNLSGLAIEHDRLAEARSYLEEALADSLRRGRRSDEMFNRGQLAEVLEMLGEWDAAAEVMVEPDPSASGASGSMLAAIRMATARGETAEARRLLQTFASVEQSTDLQDVAAYRMAEALVYLADGEPASALTVAREAMEMSRVQGQMHYAAHALASAGEAARDLHDTSTLIALIGWVESLDPVEHRRLLDAHTCRLRAIVTADASQALDHATAAVEVLRGISMPLALGIALVEHADYAAACGDEATAVADRAEAAEIFQQLGAHAWSSPLMQ